MAKRAKGLTARGVETLKTAGMHADGDGLYLNVKATGAKSWIFRYVFAGKRREMGLGAFPVVSLAEARGLVDGHRKAIEAGKDPLTIKAEPVQAVPTFGKMAEIYIATHAAAWKNAKHHDQWKNTLRDHAGNLTEKPVNEISVADVLEALTPIWSKLPETASRVRGRIEAVLDAAKAAKHRAGENPAQWKGNLKHLLPARKKLSRGHHAALPFEEVPAFVAKLRERPGVSSSQLEFIILTAARSTEAREAKWREFDIEEKVWTVPPERMKMSREHRVPLAARAVDIVAWLAKAQVAETGNATVDPDAYVFSRPKTTAAPSIAATEMLLRRMKMEVTTHGFRSSFRDWAGEMTSFPRDLAETALAHKVGDEVELAYRRGDALRKRRVMMDAWAEFCEAKEGNILPMVVPDKRA